MSVFLLVCISDLIFREEIILRLKIGIIDFTRKKKKEKEQILLLK